MIGKKFDGQTDCSEKWYDTQYKMEPIPEALLKVCKSVVPAYYHYTELLHTYFVIRLNTCKLRLHIAFADYHYTLLVHIEFAYYHYILLLHISFNY